MFAKMIKISASVFVMLTIIFALINQIYPDTVILSIAITFGTISYHYLMRLAVGYVINGIFHNRFDYSRKWFQEKKFEKHLYEVLRVKKWKDKMPTFAPEMLDLKLHTWEEIAGAMCQSLSGSYDYSSPMFRACICDINMGNILGVFYHICFSCRCGNYVCDNAAI